MKHKRTPAREYPAGFFSELVARHNWPPMFTPQLAWTADEHKRQQAAQAGRESALANGRGWATGTIVLPGTPKWTAPKAMERVA